MGCCIIIMTGSEPDHGSSAPTRRSDSASRNHAKPEFTSERHQTRPIAPDTPSPKPELTIAIATLANHILPVNE